MEPKKKPGGLIVALMGKPKKPEGDEETPTKEVAAQAVLDAIADNDAKAMADAMSSMIAACRDYEE